MFEVIPPTVVSGGFVGVAITVLITVLSLVWTGKLIPENRHKEILDIYKEQNTKLQEALTRRDDQMTKLVEHNQTTVKAWEEIRREANS